MDNSSTLMDSQTAAEQMPEPTRIVVSIPNDQKPEFAALTTLIDDRSANGRKLINTLDIRQRQKEEREVSFTEQKKLHKTMEEINQGLSLRVLTLMNSLASELDEGSRAGAISETLQELMFSPDNDNSLMEVIADLLFISNHTVITPPKRKGGNGSRLKRADVLARAHSHEWGEYGFCPKCNRPMLTSGIKAHQKHSLVCIEIKQGREKTLELGVRKHVSIGNHIAENMWMDANDSSDDE